MLHKCVCENYVDKDNVCMASDIKVNSIQQCLRVPTVCWEFIGEQNRHGLYSPTPLLPLLNKERGGKNKNLQFVMEKNSI